MFYIHHCKNDVLIGETKTKAMAFALASKSLVDADDSYDTYITSTGRGYSEIIGFGSTGELPPAGDDTDPCTRGGSVLFGRETE